MIDRSNGIALSSQSAEQQCDIEILILVVELQLLLLLMQQFSEIGHELFSKLVDEQRDLLFSEGISFGGDSVSNDVASKFSCLEIHLVHRILHGHCVVL